LDKVLFVSFSFKKKKTLSSPSLVFFLAKILYYHSGQILRLWAAGGVFFEDYDMARLQRIFHPGGPIITNIEVDRLLTLWENGLKIVRGSPSVVWQGMAGGGGARFHRQTSNEQRATRNLFLDAPRTRLAATWESSLLLE
jgi:hypothetical protein